MEVHTTSPQLCPNMQMMESWVNLSGLTYGHLDTLNLALVVEVAVVVCQICVLVVVVVVWTIPVSLSFKGGTLNDKIHAQKELFAEEVLDFCFKSIIVLVSCADFFPTGENFVSSLRQ